MPRVPGTPAAPQMIVPDELLLMAAADMHARGRLVEQATLSDGSNHQTYTDDEPFLKEVPEGMGGNAAEAYQMLRKSGMSKEDATQEIRKRIPEELAEKVPSS